MNRIVASVAALCVTVASSGVCHAREWFDDTGRHSVEARFVELDGDVIRLRRDSDSKVIKVPLSKLNERELDLLVALNHADQAEAAAYLLQNDVEFGTDDEGRIDSLFVTTGASNGWSEFYGYFPSRPKRLMHDDDLAHVGRLSSLKEVSLTVTDGLTAKGIGHLSALSNLKLLELNFENDANVDDYIAALAPLRGLQHLQLSSCYRITDTSLAAIAELTDLEVLVVEERPEGQGGLTDAGIARLASLTKLRRLIIRASEVTEASLAVVGALGSLRDLTWKSERHPLTAAGAAHLAKRDEINSLALRAASIDDQVLQAIAELPNLSHLELDSSGLADDQLETLGTCPELGWLQLNGNPLEGPGLAHLAGLRKLEMLELRDTRVAGDGLRHLTSLVYLMRLDLSGSAIRDDDLALLCDLPDLRQLRLRDTAVTDAGLLNLKGSLSLSAVIVEGSPATPAGVKALWAARRTALLGPTLERWSRAGTPCTAKSPHEAFEQFRQAILADDLATALNCIEPEMRVEGISRVAVQLHKAGAQGTQLVEPFVDAAGLDALPGKPDDEHPGAQMRHWAAAAEFVRDPQGLFGALVKLGRARGAKEWFLQPEMAQISNVRIDGDSAEAEVRVGDSERSSKLAFDEIDGVWYVRVRF